MDKLHATLHKASQSVQLDPHVRDGFRRTLAAATERDRLAFTLSAYNGGESGVRQDRLLCRNTRGCDPAAWFDNVELYSLKSRKPNPGYGSSAFKINREYIHLVMDIRRPKYDPFFTKPAK